MSHRQFGNRITSESSSTPTCPKCNTVIPDTDVNVATDVAFCRSCNVAHSLSKLAHRVQLDADVDTSRPPKGAWHRNSGMGGQIIGATHRSLGAALGALAISLFWNGIVSVFLVLVISSTIRLMGVPVPDWFPDPKMNGGGNMGVGMTIFLWLFLTPFILVGAAMIGMFFSAIGGRTEVRIRHSEGVVFSGFGPLGWKRRFNPGSVTDVRIDKNQWRDSDGDRQTKTHIIIETEQGKPIKFGTMLKEERMKFVAAATRKALLK